MSKFNIGDTVGYRRPGDQIASGKVREILYYYRIDWGPGVEANSGWTLPEDVLIPIQRLSDPAETDPEREIREFVENISGEGVMADSQQQPRKGNFLVQIERWKGRIDRVRGGQTPVVELLLRDDQYVVSVTLEEIWRMGERKTTDWRWEAYVATPIDSGEA